MTVTSTKSSVRIVTTISMKLVPLITITPFGLIA